MTQRPNARSQRKTRSHERPMKFAYVLRDDGEDITEPHVIDGNSLGHALQKLAHALPDKVSEIQVWRVSDDPIRTATVHRIGKAKPKPTRRKSAAGARRPRP